MLQLARWTAPADAAGDERSSREPQARSSINITINGFRWIVEFFIGRSRPATLSTTTTRTACSVVPTLAREPFAFDRLIRRPILLVLLRLHLLAIH